MNRRPILYGIAAALAAALVVIATPAGAQWVTNFIGRTFTSSAPSGVNGFACKTTGCRVDFGPGASDHLEATTAINIQTPGSITALQGLTSGTNGTGNIYGGLIAQSGTATLQLRGRPTDGATAIAIKLQSTNTLTTPGAIIAAFYPDIGVTQVATIDKDVSGFFQGHVEANAKLISPAVVILPSTLGTCQAGE